MYKSGIKRDRDSPPPPPPSAMSKRSRRYDNNNDSSDDDRRSRSTSRRYNEDFKRSSYSSGGGGGKERSYPYKVLCISKLHPKASDEVVRDTLYREFKRYGDISVKIVQEPDERVAFVYFRSAEDAREVKHSKGIIFIYDKAVKVEAAYESVPSGGGDGGYGNIRGRSPQPYNIQQPPHHHHHHREDYGRYERPPPPGPPPPPHYREQQYRADYRQPIQHPPHYNRYPPQPPPPHRNNPAPMHNSGHPPPQEMLGPMRYENKKDKFPNYLHHINPEEDPLATRTLFAGNLEVNITDEELRRIFGRYGTVEDIDIKRPPPGTGNAYAFVRFVNLDMSARAKAELSGQYIGKFQCKIGYGKMNPTTKIWVGGLGPWTTMGMLEQEFDRFGCIKKIDWAKGEPVAYITYETIDAAQAAVKDMRGYPLGGPDKRLRTDFADAGAPIINYENNGQRKEYGGGDDHSNTPIPHRASLSPHSTHSALSDDSPLSTAKTINEIAKKAQLGWTGALILKNSSFPTKFYLTDGDIEIENLLKDEEGKTNLRITQRLRLDQAKLDDVQKRITTSQSHGVFLSLPASSSSVASSPIDSQDTAVQTRPLRNLVSYLKQKEAAGVISLSKDGGGGVLYAFPPCPFSWDLLRRSCSGLVDSATEDHLVVVVIRGGGTGV